MKFTITREQFQEGLVAVAASVPAKTTLPVLANILLEATKDGLRHFRHRPGHRCQHDGACQSWTRKAPSRCRPGSWWRSSGSCRARASGSRRRASSGSPSSAASRSSSSWACRGRSSPPSRPSAFDGGWRIAARELHKLIGHVAFAASTEESRPILNGVLWELRPDKMRMVATNGHRLARMDVPVAGQQDARQT